MVREISENSIEVSCVCGSEQCGKLISRRVPDDPEMFLEFVSVRYASTFWGRIKNTIEAFRNRPVKTYLVLSKKDCKALADFMRGKN